MTPIQTTTAGLIDRLLESALEEAVGLSWVRGSDGAGSAGESPTRAASDRGGPPVIPGYQVLKQIRAGGQAVVYLGVQEATERHTAIKVFGLGGELSPKERFRLEREVEALQQIRHPAVVRIIDSDAKAARPYIVTEYIPGWDLDEYFREHSLDVCATMAMLKTIAHALHAAHQKGVIHRDVKPGNIRVDHNGNPHVFDFGLARSDATPAADRSLTQDGQFLGTFYWVSPEQADGRLREVDVRADVYSLGAVLFYMLTGRMPFETGGSVRDVLNRIATAEPIRPRAIRAEIDDDVETIVLKCLAKDPAKRYASAEALADDVERWSGGRPIAARRESWAYVTRKFLTRHPGWCGFGVGVAATLAVLLWVSRVDLTDKLRSAESSLQVARMQVSLANLVKDKMQRDLDERNNDPNATRRCVAEVSEKVNVLPASARIPFYEALARHCLQWELYPEGYNLALRAARDAQEAHGRRSGEYAATAALCARLALETNDWDAARRFTVDAAKLTEGLAGDAHAEACAQASYIMWRLEDLPEATRFADAYVVEARRAYGDDDAGLARPLKLAADMYKDIAVAMRRCGQDAGVESALAESFAHRAAELGRRCYADDPPRFSDCLNSLAVVLRETGDLSEAEAAAREALSIRRACFAQPELYTQWLWLHSSMQTLALVLQKRGRFAEGAALLEEAIEGVVKFNRFHPELNRYRAVYAKDLSDLYAAWNTAEPGRGYDALAERWAVEGGRGP